MMKLKWIITDELYGITATEYDTEWNGICGFAKMAIDKDEIGWMPEDDLLRPEEGDYDILYILGELLDSILVTNKRDKKIIMLLTHNLAEITVERNETDYLICLCNTENNSVIWEHYVACEEFVSVIVDAANSFLDEIQKINADLKKTRDIKRLIENLYSICNDIDTAVIQKGNIP